MRILALSKYDCLAASPRHRFVQYRPHLARYGMDLMLSPLFDDAYLRTRFSTGGVDLRAVVRAYLRRVTALLGSWRWDLAIVHCELFPYLPSCFERTLRLLKVPYVYDYDDAIFHMYDAHARHAVRWVLGRKLAPLISGAAAVMAGSRYLARYAEHFNPRVHVVPTVVDLARYPRRPQRARTRGASMTVGWIGSSSTSQHLQLVGPALAELAREGPLRLMAVGARPMKIPGVSVEIRAWSEQREAQDLAEVDVGIMPLPDEPWARGKCAFKLIQYMAAGLPTVASPVGVNSEVVTPKTGLFASTHPEWVDALRRLRNAPSMGQAMGERGRQRVERHYSLQSQNERVRRILTEAVPRPKTWA